MASIIGATAPKIEFCKEIDQIKEGKKHDHKALALTMLRGIATNLAQFCDDVETLSDDKRDYTTILKSAQTFAQHVYKGKEETAVSLNILDDSDKQDSEVYSMFPIQDQFAWRAFCQQEIQEWTAKEMRFEKDKEQFPHIKPRYQDLVTDTLAFFAPADGMVSMSALPFLKECKTYSEMAFILAQLKMEVVHSEGYGTAVEAIIPDKIQREKVFKMIDHLPCVKAKGQFIKDYMHVGLPEPVRYAAQAFEEGVFFPTLFSAIFYLRQKGVMATFIFLNEQISKDETLHRDYYAIQAEKKGVAKYAEIIYQMARRVVDIEADYIRYMLRTPIDSRQADEAAGMTVKNLILYAQNLVDQVLSMMGFTTLFNVKVELPWMRDISLAQKNNFYEIQVGSYKRGSLSDAIDWEARAGLKKSEIDAANDPLSVDF